MAELQARWGPFQANAGAYELSGNTLTLRILVSKDPAGQRDGTFARLTVAMDGNTLSLTPVENDVGRIVAGVTTRYSSRRVTWQVVRDARVCALTARLTRSFPTQASNAFAPGRKSSGGGAR